MCSWIAILFSGQSALVTPGCNKESSKLISTISYFPSYWRLNAIKLDIYSDLSCCFERSCMSFCIAAFVVGGSRVLLDVLVCFKFQSLLSDARGEGSANCNTWIINILLQPNRFIGRPHTRHKFQNVKPFGTHIFIHFQKSDTYTYKAVHEHLKTKPPKSQ